MRYPRRPPHPSRECVVSPKPAPKKQPGPPPAPAQFSPSLLFLLSLVFKDGFTGPASMGMLREMLPYLGKQDAHAARQLLQVGDTAKELSLLPIHHTPQLQPSRSWLTQSERFLGLLDVLQRYGGQNSVRTLEQLRRYILLRDKFMHLQHHGLDASCLPDIAALLDNCSTGAAAQVQQAMSMMNVLSGMNGGNLAQIMNMMRNFG